VQKEQDKKSLSPKIFVVLDTTVNNSIKHQQSMLKVKPIIKNIVESMRFDLVVFLLTRRGCLNSTQVNYFGMGFNGGTA
jgi:hypothetical protein